MDRPPNNHRCLGSKRIQLSGIIIIGERMVLDHISSLGNVEVKIT